MHIVKNVNKLTIKGGAERRMRVNRYDFLHKILLPHIVAVSKDCHNAAKFTKKQGNISAFMRMDISRELVLR